VTIVPVHTESTSQRTTERNSEQQRTAKLLLTPGADEFEQVTKTASI